MPIVNVSVKNKIAIVEEGTVAVCGNSDYTIVFDFDAEWNNYETKTARFAWNGKFIDVIFNGNICAMPAIYETIYAAIGVYAGELHTTTPAYLPMRKSILCGFGTQIDPTPSVYDQIMERIAEIEEGKYAKPNEGIPKTDLENSVQESLEKANTAIQQHQSLDAYRTSDEQDVIDLSKADASDVETIEKLIPPQATEQNKLADKAFVNSSIGTNTANYISNNGQPFSSLEQLESYRGTVTNNDYAFVTGTDEAGNTYFDRYKATVSGTTFSWAKEYRLNNSSFTAAQWAAIESGITSGLVGLISTALQPDDLTPYRTSADQDVIDAEKVSTADYAPVSKTDAMTLPVGRDTDGKLYAQKPDAEQYELIETITIDEDVSQIRRTQDAAGNAYNFKRLLLYFDSTGIEGYKSNSLTITVYVNSTDATPTASTRIVGKLTINFPSTGNQRFEFVVNADNKIAEPIGGFLTQNSSITQGNEFIRSFTLASGGTVQFLSGLKISIYGVKA